MNSISTWLSVGAFALATTGIAVAQTTTAASSMPAVPAAPAMVPGAPPAHPHSKNPIHVNSCSAQQGQQSQTFSGWYGRTYFQPGTPSTLSISYVNRSHVAAKKIRFGLIANGRLVTEVQDLGTFSQGAEINHTFGVSNNIFPLGTGLYRCVAGVVNFVDGTVYHSPNVQQLLREAQGL